MAANQREMLREEEFLRQDIFRRSAFLIIDQMVSSSPTHPSVFVDECLHSVFFAGMIHKPAYPPKDIVSDDEMLTRLQSLYPQPFKLYLTHLPKRSPFSCVLDMFVHHEPDSEEKEHRVIKLLQTFIEPLKEQKATDLISSTICISQTKPVSSSTRYYGVSMSTFNRVHGKIMVTLSCLSTWDSYVADAVITYNPNKVMKNYFNGTLQLQELIRCEAFSLGNGTPKEPCRSCGNLFGLTTQEIQEWPYGHCAEAESISNLFKGEDGIRQRALPEYENYTDENRQRAKVSVLKDLRKFLRDVGFESWYPALYSPLSN